MFCKNCGNEAMPGAVACVKCGVALGTGNNFCQNCGQPSDPNAVICIHCGAALAQSNNSTTGGAAKSKLVAGLLGIFLGSLGVHNFYLGYTVKAIIQLVLTIVGGPLTCGIAAIASSIWALVEGILILTGKIAVDGKGVPLKD